MTLPFYATLPRKMESSTRSGQFTFKKNKMDI